MKDILYIVVEELLQTALSCYGNTSMALLPPRNTKRFIRLKVTQP